MTDKPRDPAFDLPCSVCDAPPGEGCRDDDGVPKPSYGAGVKTAAGATAGAPGAPA